MAKESRGILNLVDQNGRRMVTKEGLRIPLRLGSKAGEIEGDVVMVGKDLSQEGGLSGLSGPGQHQDRMPS